MGKADVVLPPDVNLLKEGIYDVEQIVSVDIYRTTDAPENAELIG